MSLTIIKFSAKWCGPCKKIQPFVESLVERYQPNLKVTYVDVNEDEDMTNEYNVEVLPTFVFLVDDKEVYRLEDANEELLETMIKKYITPDHLV